MTNLSGTERWTTGVREPGLSRKGIGLKDESWREFRARFPGGMNWREFLGYIRDDRVMKTRLVVLVVTALLGLATLIAMVTGQWPAAAMCFVAMLVTAFVGSSA